MKRSKFARNDSKTFRGRPRRWALATVWLVRSASRSNAGPCSGGFDHPEFPESYHAAERHPEAMKIAGLDLYA